MPRETDFHRELIKDMRSQGVRLAKVPDAPVSHMMTKDNKRIRFSPPKFVDLIGVGNEIEKTDRARFAPPPWGRPLIWEAKLMKTLHAWPLSTLRDEQLQILLDFAGVADARVIINYRVKNYTQAQLDKYGLANFVDHKRINVLTSVMPSAILDAKEHGWKSIPVAELARSFVGRPWGGPWSYEDIIRRSVWAAWD